MGLSKSQTDTASRVSHIVLYAGIAIILAFFWPGNRCSADETASNNPESVQNSLISDGSITSHGPAYVSVWHDPPNPLLITGETDSLTIVVQLDTTAFDFPGLLSWNHQLKRPVVAWIAAPRASGIAFVTGPEPGNTSNQTMIKLRPQPGMDESTLTGSVLYTVESGAKTGQNEIVIDIVADLVAEDGKEIQDAGVVRLPVEIDTHLSTKIMTLAIVALAIFLFIVEWVRVDVVAIIIMILLPELGLLKSSEAFRGLSSNAVIAIIGVMIISYGLNRTGLVNMAIQPMLRHVKKGATKLVIVFSSVIALISSVMQNTGAAVLFLPAIRRVALKELKISISRVLMPIGMAAILGGTLTMIGTSPLILLNDILPQGMEKFGFLELTPIGLAIVIGGILYLSTIGMRLLENLPINKRQPEISLDNGTEKDCMALYPGIEGPFELVVPRGYTPTGGPQELAAIRRRSLVNIVAMVTQENFLDIAPHPQMVVQQAKALCVYGSRRQVEGFANRYGLILQTKPDFFHKDMFNPSYAGTVEMVISPRSSLIGKCIRDIRFRETYKINALALHQGGVIYYQELADRSLHAGDVILINGKWEQLQALKENHQNFIIMSPKDVEIHRPYKAKFALISFAAALILMLISSFYFQKMPYNPIPLSVCLMIGAIGMVLSKVMTISEAYNAIDWRTVFLLAGLIPLGVAVEHTGTAQWIAHGIVVGLGNYMSPLLLLVVLAVLSCLFTMVVSNVGACALLVPLGIAIAHKIGINPRVAAIVVGIGVSNSFLLPTHQVNALYMGPGDYQTKDYIKIGGGLSLVYITVLVIVTYLLYL